MHCNRTEGFAARVMKRTFGFYTSPHILRIIDFTFRFTTKFGVLGSSCAPLQRREPILVVIMVSLVMLCMEEAEP